jgi:hypothetical protein
VPCLVQQAALQRILSSNDASASDTAHWPRTVQGMAADDETVRLGAEDSGMEWNVNATTVLPGPPGSDSSSSSSSSSTGAPEIGSTRVKATGETVLETSLQKVRIRPHAPPSATTATETLF